MLRKLWKAMISVGYKGDSYQVAEARHVAIYVEACAQGGFHSRLHGFLASRLLIRGAEWLAFESRNSNRKVLLAALHMYEEDRMPGTAQLHLGSALQKRSDGSLSGTISARSSVEEPSEITYVTIFMPEDEGSGGDDYHEDGEQHGSGCQNRARPKFRRLFDGIPFQCTAPSAAW